MVLSGVESLDLQAKKGVNQPPTFLINKFLNIKATNIEKRKMEAVDSEHQSFIA